MLIKTLRKIMKHITKKACPIKQIKKDYNKQHVPSTYKNTKRAAVAYRENEEAILKGNIPEKYRRIIPYVPGKKILEIGAAEGVLSLLLSKDKEMVYGLDISPHRHELALKLQNAWLEQGYDVGRCKMLLGDLIDYIDLLKEVDTVVAVRVIYHFKEEIDVNWVFSEIGKHVKNVVLVGNERKAKYFLEISKDFHTSPVPYYYSTVEGMKHLLKSNGYNVTNVVDEGDPIVVGSKKLLRSA